MRTETRVVVATNRHLAAHVQAGRFRSDSFYRLNAFPVHVPTRWIFAALSLPLACLAEWRIARSEAA